MKKYPIYRVALLLFFGMIIAGACSTTKNTFVTRTYHNINSRYNGYFYARESMKDAQAKIDLSYVDDYSQLLPLFPLPNTPETKNCFADLEKAIKKATTCIEHHAITTKSGAEIAGAVKWIDDCYLVIGQAHYYKGEYLTSLEIFDYMIQKYSAYPIKTDAMLWKAKTQIALGAFTQAESILDVVSNDKTTSKKTQAETKATYADLYMQTGNYVNAIKFLEEAIALTSSKKTLARYTFVLAQLYEKVGKEEQAFTNFGKVEAMHPNYNMYFNAKLNRARLSAANEKNRTQAKKDLLKMLEDAKNTEYQDQIYYTLAQLEQRSGNKTGAMNYYKQSVAASMGNSKQKALSYLALGDIYFAETDYPNAQAYYDSTMDVLPKDYPGYKAISEKHKSLGNLVRFINIVTLEDSVQAIAKKYGDDTTKLYAYIDKLIQQKAEEDKRKKEQLEQQTITSTSPGTTGGNGGANQFYFYNSSNVAFGINEFTRKWGNRKLEDNWRRANKESIMPDENDQPDNKDTSGTKSNVKATSKQKAREPYLKNIPLTPDAVAKSDDRIADALYNLGTLYKEQMNNTTKAAEAFETLAKRYPNHKYALASHFQLWRLYKTTGETAKSEQHKNYICTNFPKSDYCELINNPGAVQGRENERIKIDQYYSETYEAYTKKDFLQVISRCNYADTTFDRKNEHAAQFAYLKAVSVGKTQGNAAMETELTKLIANYPKDPMRQQAQALLDALHKIKGLPVPADTVQAASSGPSYLENENVEYQYMVVVDNGKGDINKFKIGISDYNSQMFASSGLTINSMVLDNLHTLVLVKNFDSSKKAMEYYNLLKSKGDIFANLTPGTFQVMTISTENFAMFFKDKNVDTYKAFFDAKLKK